MATYWQPASQTSAASLAAQGRSPATPVATPASPPAAYWQPAAQTSAESLVAQGRSIDNPNFQPAPKDVILPTEKTPVSGADQSSAKTIAEPQKNILGETLAESNAKVDKYLADKQGAEINALVSSGRAFNEIDAKNYAASKGEANWQQYVNGTGGKANPLYIGATNWASLQKQYSPYQLSQATTKTKDGIYWNPAVNIGEIQKTDPSVQINADAKKIANIVTDAKKSADKFSNASTEPSTEAPTLATDAKTNEATIMAELTGKVGKSAEEVYNELYNTPEMKAASSDVAKYKSLNDEYDQQIDELKDDIRKEVEGEASDSYIAALAAVRGDKILKLKRANQRDLDSANATLTGLKENAANLLTVRVKDTDTRYNNLFQMLQLQIQQEGTKFNQSAAVAQIQMNLPEGRSITVAGTTYTGLKENDNLNVIQFTDASRKTYVIGVDKKTGAQVYKQFIGNSPAPQGSVTSPVTELNNYNATNELAATKELNAEISAGKTAIGYDDKGNPFYYDKIAYDEAAKSAGSDWNPFTGTPNKIDFRK